MIYTDKQMSSKNGGKKMTKKQYEEAIKSILANANEALKKVKTNEEKFNILTAQNMQLQSITEEFQRTRID